MSEKEVAKLPWERFCRLINAADKSFYGCVNRDGLWFDSSQDFDTAIHWCCYFAGQFNLTPKDELVWMRDEGAKLGYSVIHSSLLRKMYEKGLIK